MKNRASLAIIYSKIVQHKEEKKNSRFMQKFKDILNELQITIDIEYIDHIITVLKPSVVNLREIKC